MEVGACAPERHPVVAYLTRLNTPISRESMLRRLNIVARLLSDDTSEALHFRPHDMRRSFLSNLLDAGVDLATTQQLAGHSNPKTTSAYDRRGVRAKRQARRRLPFPGGAP